MGLLDVIFGSQKKIYANQVERLTSSHFDKRIKFDIEGEKKELKSEEIKELVKNMCQGGATLTGLEEKFKKMGLRNDRMKDRIYLMKILKNLVN